MSDWSSTLYNGYNGLSVMANNLSVIGNNIANVNTTGYKTAISSFEDIFSSLDDGKQIGNGAKLADVRRFHGQGASATSTIGTNLAISGDGLFMVRKPGDSEVSAYTRDGNFHPVEASPSDPLWAPDTLKLVNSQGYAVQGRNLASTPTPTAATDFEDIMLKNVSPPKATTAINLALNLEHNTKKIETVNSTLYENWDGSKVDAKGKPLPIGSQAYDYQEQIRIIDPEGNPQNLTIYFDHTDDPNQQEFLVTSAPNLDHRLIDASGSRYNSGPTTSDKGAGALLYGTLQFDTNGELVNIATFNVPADGNVAHTTATNRIQLGRGEGTDKFTYNFNGLASGDTVTSLQFGNQPQAQMATSPNAAYTGRVNAGGREVTALTSWGNVNDDRGKQVANGDVLTFTGTNGEGTAVSYAYTVDTSKKIDDLLSNLGSQFGATATLEHGALQLTDLLPGNSQLAISAIAYSDRSGATPTTNANLAQVFGPQGAPFTTTAFSRDAPGLVATTNYAKPSVTLYKTQDGVGTGRLETLSVDKNGIISGHYSNGDTIAQAQVLLADFVTLDVTKQFGHNNTTDMSNNGARTISVPGVNGLGRVMGNTLEESNVDIGKEFANLIITQRAFQANAKSISTADAIFDKILAMKR